MGFRSGLDGDHSSLEIKSIFCSRNHCWVMLAVCAGAPSCWKVQLSSLKCFEPACWTSGSRISPRYVLAFIFAPAVTKMRSVRESAEIPAQTMTEAGFWHRGINFKFSGTSLTLGERILSFWEFEACSIVNNFSSENNILASV